MFLNLEKETIKLTISLTSHNSWIGHSGTNRHFRASIEEQPETRKLQSRKITTVSKCYNSMKITIHIYSSITQVFFNPLDKSNW